MKLKFLFALALMAIIGFKTYAQVNAGKISGIIRDAGNKILAGTTIVLNNISDTTLKQIRIADNNGAFVFDKLQKGNYALTVSNIGYNTYINNHLTIADAHLAIVLPVIILHPAGGQILKQVIIIAKKPLIEQKIDRTIVNVDAMISAAGSNALEVLSKTPGVHVDQNGDIQLNGRAGVLLLIDDRPTYLSVQDLAAYLKSLPADILDKIELMSNPPAKYDASGSAVINLQLKKNKAAGFNGNISGSYSQGFYSRTNNALNFNYRAKKLNVFGNISYNHDANYTINNSIRYFYNAVGAINSSILLDSRYSYQSSSWNARTGVDYFAGPNTTLGLLINTNTRPKTDVFNYSGQQFNSIGAADTLSKGFTSGNYHWKSGGINLNLMHKFNNNGQKISADLDYIRYLSSGDQLSPGNIFLADGAPVSSSTYLYRLPSAINIYSAKTDYALPLKGKAQIDAGVKSSFVKTDNNNQWFNLASGGFIPDYANSNHFIYSENISSAYISGSKEWKRWAVQAGLRAENTHADGHQLANAAIPDSTFHKNYTRLFPSLYILHKLDTAGNNTLAFSYSVRVRRPNYQQLNPFLFYINPYTYSAGNPNLNPQFNHIYELRYSYRQFFDVSLLYFHTNPDIYNITQLIGNVFISRPENFGINNSINFHADVNVSPVKKWDLNAALLVFNLTNKGDAFGQVISDNHTTGEIELSNQFQFNKGWSAEFNIFYHGKGYGGQTVSDAIWLSGGGVQKKIVNGNGTIRLKMDDIFHSLKNRQVTTGLGAAEAINTSESDSRVIGLSFSYRFGKAANARKSNHADSGAEDEKGRTN